MQKYLSSMTVCQRTTKLLGGTNIGAKQLITEIRRKELALYVTQAYR